MSWIRIPEVKRVLLASPEKGLHGRHTIGARSTRAQPYAELYHSKSNALIVKTDDEFAELVKKIEEKKLDAVNILVDIADVTAKCKKVVSSLYKSICHTLTHSFGSATVMTPHQCQIKKRPHVLTW